MKKVLLLLLSASSLYAGHFVAKTSFYFGSQIKQELQSPQEAAEDYFGQIKKRNHDLYNMFGRTNLRNTTLKSILRASDIIQANKVWFQQKPLTGLAAARLESAMRQKRQYRTAVREEIGFRHSPRERNIIIPALMHTLTSLPEGDFIRRILPYMIREEVLYFCWKRAR